MGNGKNVINDEAGDAYDRFAVYSRAVCQMSRKYDGRSHACQTHKKR